jgi:hypothetical protein
LALSYFIKHEFIDFDSSQALNSDLYFSSNCKMVVSHYRCGGKSSVSSGDSLYPVLAFFANSGLAFCTSEIR